MKIYYSQSVQKYVVSEFIEGESKIQGTFNTLDDALVFAGIPVVEDDDSDLFEDAENEEE